MIVVVVLALDTVMLDDEDGDDVGLVIVSVASLRWVVDVGSVPVVQVVSNAVLDAGGGVNDDNQ